MIEIHLFEAEDEFFGKAGGIREVDFVEIGLVIFESRLPLLAL